MAPEPLLSVCHRGELIETIAGEMGILWQTTWEACLIHALRQMPALAGALERF